MTELYCVFYIKSNGFSAQNLAISTHSASNHQISQILWKPLLHIVKIFLKKFQSLYNFFKNPRIQETFRKNSPCIHQKCSHSLPDI